MSHNEHCPVEATLELIGGKYKTLILWHLADKKLRFSQLRREITGITPKMLTQQLRELETHALVHREVFPIVPPKVEYSLTDLGKSLIPILVAMRDWGSGYLRGAKNLEPNCFMMGADPILKHN
jgi:DNA-binding HxlR family transcriptional regulator